jgi:FkbM family methyltransferase
MQSKHYYEIRPGYEALRYLFSYGFLTFLSKRAEKRPRRMFTQISGSIDRHVLSEGYFEKGVLELLGELCERTGHVARMIDVGANIGNHSIGMAETFSKIEAVEPHPVLFKILQANVAVNGLGTKITCHHVGLADENTTGTLVESASEHGLSRVRERSVLAPEVFGLSKDSFGEEHTVELVSASEFVTQFSEDLDKTFIKIDVEGMEGEIIGALSGILSTHTPLVGFEWFTASQPDLGRFVEGLPKYELWGIRVHDSGRNYLKRALRMVFRGRSYTLEKLDLKNLDDVYPLALMIPTAGMQ